MSMHQAGETLPDEESAAWYYYQQQQQQHAATMQGSEWARYEAAGRTPPTQTAYGLPSAYMMDGASAQGHPYAHAYPQMHGFVPPGAAYPNAAALAYANATGSAGSDPNYWQHQHQQVPPQRAPWLQPQHFSPQMQHQQPQFRPPGGARGAGPAGALRMQPHHPASTRHAPHLSGPPGAAPSHPSAGRPSNPTSEADFQQRRVPSASHLDQKADSVAGSSNPAAEAAGSGKFEASPASRFSVLTKLPPLPPLPVESASATGEAKEDAVSLPASLLPSNWGLAGLFPPGQDPVTRLVAYIKRLEERCEAYEKREEAWAWRVEALAFEPTLAWRTLEDDKEQVGGGGDGGDKAPAPILGVRLLQRVQELTDENEELGRIVGRKIGIEKTQQSSEQVGENAGAKKETNAGQRADVDEQGQVPRAQLEQALRGKSASDSPCLKWRAHIPSSDCLFRPPPHPTGSDAHTLIERMDAALTSSEKRAHEAERALASAGERDSNMLEGEMQRLQVQERGEKTGQSTNNNRRARASLPPRPDHGTTAGAASNPHAHGSRNNRQQRQQGSGSTSPAHRPHTGGRLSTGRAPQQSDQRQQDGPEQ